ncbi:hypothetical protein [Methylobacterium brachythecii]|uniref:Uncharacterized protein n=1 Tax=Methylobacterium brachythecii TaxID=1176177 RepID=A0A7W6F937_9HYPH|nr:hypothetical protein [Methylobacterium brachythecii]MBB3905075.1 hypothetical protein [Methylobacterium brachythecii]GLS44417.1 hypothetical protein GCM10007884_24050 [Methylobacterium brachythecii]
MTDLSQTIAPKSDQLNADDLIGRPRTIRVTRVSRASEPDQPIAINFEGDGGKPYKPCKSMRRVLVMVWGEKGETYAGRRMTLYRDDSVMFGGQAVGGIRISHVSDIDRAVTMALTVTRTSRKPYTVKPLAAERPQTQVATSASPSERGSDQSHRSDNHDRSKPPAGTGMSENGWARLCGDARKAAKSGSDALRRFREDLHPDHDRALDAISDELDDLTRRADDDDGFRGDAPLDHRETEHA